ncbi:MAG: hypothetical protein H7246_21200 [Phycisphaerae bacterium]|nr:hypothetical protein [Saprospiraceae bacterium]
MPTETNTSGKQNIVIQRISDSTITLNVDGEVREIHNQLAELKALLQNKQAQTVQYADKIYNIEHIDEANFGFVTGKKAFNEYLTKALIEAIQADCLPAQRFLEKVSAIEDWETQMRISDKAKEIIAYSFVGVIGIQLSKLMAIGKEDFSEAKQRKYIEKCLHIAKRSLDLINFSLLSRLWDAQNEQPRQFSKDQKTALAHHFDHPFEPSLDEQFRLLAVLHRIFSQKENALVFPLPELENFGVALEADSILSQVCRALKALNEKLDKAQYDLLDCFEAEKQLAELLAQFHFLVHYNMASMKHIGYRQIREEAPHYLHRYTALGIDSKANLDAEKINYTPEPGHTDAVLLFRGEDYRDSINLSPFVIDYNALTFEQGAKICFFRSSDIADGSLDYVFLIDNSSINIQMTGTLKPDTDYNELMMSNEKWKNLNIDNVVRDFRLARRTLLGDDALNLDDL